MAPQRWLPLALYVSAAACSAPVAKQPESTPPPTKASSPASERPCENWIAGAKARQLVQAGAVLLDVRSQEEFDEKHLEGATLIPVQELESRSSELAPGKHIVVYCRSGKRAARAASLLREKGFEVSEIGTMSQYAPSASPGCSEPSPL